MTWTVDRVDLPGTATTSRSDMMRNRATKSTSDSTLRPITSRAGSGRSIGQLQPLMALRLRESAIRHCSAPQTILVWLFAREYTRANCEENTLTLHKFHRNQACVRQVQARVQRIQPSFRRERLAHRWRHVTVAKNWGEAQPGRHSVTRRVQHSSVRCRWPQNVQNTRADVTSGKARTPHRPLAGTAVWQTASRRSENPDTWPPRWQSRLRCASCSR